MRFLFVDQILTRDITHITGVKHITPEDPFLCQMPNETNFCFIPTLIGETVGQLAAWLVMFNNDFRFRPVAGVVAEAIMHKPAYVGDTLLLNCEIVSQDDVAVEYFGHASVNGHKVFSVNGAIGPMLPMQDFIDQAVVKQQFDEINRVVDVVDFQETLSLDQNAYAFSTYPMQFDGILAIEPKQSCRAFKKISRSAPYFLDHFPNKPVLPLTLLLECKRRLAQSFLSASDWAHKYRLKRMERIKMSDFVQPGHVVESELLVKKQNDTQLVLHLRSFVANKRVCVVDLVFDAEV